MTAELLRVRDLAVSFATEGGTAKVLDRVNLTIGRGQIVGLVGESGCGKTTRPARSSACCRVIRRRLVAAASCSTTPIC